MDSSVVQQHFNFANNYAKNAVVQQKSAIDLLQFVQQNISKTNSLKQIIDLGCGSGFMANLFAEQYKNSKITAVDFSQTMLNNAKNTYQQPNIIWQQQNIEQLLLPNKYNLAISNFVFQWINKPQLLLQNILKYTDNLVFAVPLKSSFMAWNTICQYYGVANRLVDFLTLEQWQQLINNLNLTQVSQCKIHWQGFSCPLDAAKYFKLIGANASTAKIDNSLVKLRKIKKPLFLNFDVAYFFISK